MGIDSTTVRLAIAFALIGLAGLIVPDWAVFLATLALAKALVVLGLLILWRTGLVPFGQALYFGIGAYTVGLLGRLLGATDIVLLTVMGTLIAAGLGGLVGLLLARYRDIFFAMLSMAFSMILYGILLKTEALGSTDGFNVEPPTFLGYAPEGQSLQISIFLWTVLLSFIAAYAVHRYLSSALGQLAAAIRDNEIRVEYLGVSVQTAIHIKVVVAAALAGAGGAITAFSVGHIDPDAMCYWTVSGEFVFVTILSGTGSIAAPFLGSVIFQVIRTYAFEYSPYTWQMVLGGSLLLIILFVPNGLWSLVTRLRREG
jgi:branched-chain amino acid transport system permease protein